jgi:predicted RNA binding protein YcfA (HicA-like mRNA interferase family)
VSELPRVSGREVIKALQKFGYERDRQRGSHVVLRQASEPHRRVVVPDHKEVAKGLSGLSLNRLG